jgi:hypothetical protein
MSHLNIMWVNLRANAIALTVTVFGPLLGDFLKPPAPQVVADLLSLLQDCSSGETTADDGQAAKQQDSD